MNKWINKYEYMIKNKIVLFLFSKEKFLKMVIWQSGDAFFSEQDTLNPTLY